MKKVATLTMAALAVFLVSCVSIQDDQMSMQERVQANIVGSVSMDFTSFQFFHRASRRNLTNRVRIELTRVARQQYGPNAEVRNITILGRGSGWQALYGIGIPALTFVTTGIVAGGRYGWFYGTIAGTLVFGGLNLIGNFQRITATGDVIMHGATSDFPMANMNIQGMGANVNAERLVEAVNAASHRLINNIPPGETIAILNIHSTNPAIAAFILGDLEFQFVSSGRFTMVDRHRLEQIRSEQDFHLSGEVSDASAASIGNMLGAGLVITGDIGADVLGNRLTLRVLNVSTAQIVDMAIERF